MGSSEAGSSGGSNSALAGVSILQGYGEFKASEAQASYTRSVYDANAELYMMQAADTLKRADKEAGKYKRKVKGLLGSQRARMAAAGIDISDVDSSAYQIQEETLKYGYQDVQQIKNNAFREAMGLKTQSLLTQVEGKFKAATMRTQGRLGLITSGLKSAQYGTSAYNDFAGDNEETTYYPKGK